MDCVTRATSVEQTSQGLLTIVAEEEERTTCRTVVDHEQSRANKRRLCVPESQAPDLQGTGEEVLDTGTESGAGRKKQMRCCALLVCLVVAVTALPVLGQETVVLDGTVRDGATGAPQAGAHVTLVGTPMGSATTADGEFRIPGVPVGQYTVRITMDGYPVRQFKTTLQAGCSEPVHAVLLREGLEIQSFLVTSQHHIKESLSRELSFSRIAARSSEASPADPVALLEKLPVTLPGTDPSVLSPLDVGSKLPRDHFFLLDWVKSHWPW
ncbi:hypothetical protein GF324_13765 [bacterium]|nr:hypothetical protein [bacterium]